MRRLIAITQLSLDGVMQAPGGPGEDASGGFSHGGWAMPFVDEAAGRVIGEIIAEGLVDEFRLWVFPVVLGRGKRLFESGVPPAGLALVDTRNTPSGVLLNTYRPSGPLPRG